MSSNRLERHEAAMLQALIHNKLGNSLYGNQPRFTEDVLTSSVFGPLHYLPSALFLKLIKSACRIPETFPTDDEIGEVLEVQFWKGMNAEGTTNHRTVEPDVVIKATRLDIIIEVKKRDDDKEYAQSISQWDNEIRAYFNNHKDSDSVVLLALGGNRYCGETERLIDGKRIHVFMGSWYNLLRGISREIDNHAANINSSLCDVRDILKRYRYFEIKWLCSLKPKGLSSESTEVFNRLNSATHPFFSLYRPQNPIKSNNIGIWIK